MSEAGDPAIAGGRTGAPDRLEEASVRQLPLALLVVLCLTPGALGALAYLLLSGPVQSAGYPASPRCWWRS